jgi:hypothetical protein
MIVQPPRHRAHREIILKKQKEYSITTISGSVLRKILDIKIKNK